MKKELKVKLIFPPALDEVTMSMPPLSLAALATYLKNNQVNVEVDDVFAKIRYYNNNRCFFSPKRIFLEDLNSKNLDYLFNKPINKKLDNQLTRILGLFEYEDYDVLGFSIHTYSQFVYALLLAKKVKEQKNITTFFGGPIITLMGDKFFDKFGFIDYMVRGDGEAPLLRLIKSLRNKDNSFKKIPGLLYRSNNRSFQNRIRHFKIRNCPTPSFKFLDLDIYKILVKNDKQLILPYQISKGCINKCSFCTHRLLNQFEIKPLSVVLNDLKMLKRKHNTKYFFFCDSNINNSKKFLYRLCDALIKNHLGIVWGAFASVNNLDKRLLEKMKRAGCQVLFFGVESGSDRLLRLMNKRYTSKQASKVLECSHKAGIENIVSFITGFPSENQDDVKRTVDFIKHNSVYITHPKLIRFMLEYNSEVYMHPKRFKITNLKIDFTHVLTGRNIATYDGADGLNWEAIKKQQEKSYDLCLKTLFYYVKKPGFSPFLKLIPYNLYRLISANRYKKSKVLNYMVYAFYNRGNGLKDYYMPFIYFR